MTQLPDEVVEQLVQALAGIEGRVDYAIGMYHDATRWYAEDDPDGNGSLRDYVFREVHAAIAAYKAKSVNQ